MRKQLTIVTPQYSETAQMMESLFMSIKHQVGYDLNKVEMIIVGDCGPVKLTQKDLEYMRLPFKVTLTQAPKNGGPGVARQIGIDMAEGEWVVSIDADDIFSPDALASFQFALDQNPNLKWINFTGKVVGVDNQRAIIQDHRSELIWSFGHFINTDWLRKKKVKYHPEIRSNEEQVFFQALWIRTQHQLEYAHVPYPVYYWDQKSTNTITRYNGGEYSRTCVPEFFKGRNIVLDDFESIGKIDDLTQLAYQSLVHGYYTVHQTMFDDYPEWKENAEQWIGWIWGKYAKYVMLLDPRYRLQILLQAAVSCDRQISTTFENWLDAIATTEQPKKCLLPKEDMNKSLNRPE